MISIVNAVKNIVYNDPFLFESMRRGIINGSALAKEIHLKVEEFCKKEVQINSIVTTLHRMQTKVQNEESLFPDFGLESITLKTNLLEVALDLSPEVVEIKKWVQDQAHKNDDLFFLTVGVKETSIVLSQSLYNKLVKKFPKLNIKGVVPNLTALTAVYDSRHSIYSPNSVYALLSALAVHRINIVELVTTYSEVTFLVEDDLATKTFESLRPFLI